MLSNITDNSDCKWYSGSKQNLATMLERQKLISKHCKTKTAQLVGLEGAIILNLEILQNEASFFIRL